MASLKDFRIDGDLAGAQQRAVEVVVTMDDGALRWCYFMTPAALASAGDWVPGTRVRFHYGTPHMIVVSELSADIIARVLQHLDRNGELAVCTRAVEGAG
jgi:hypothetical protein